ncbi:hypothetical protein [Mycolicibacterium neoaurum]|uniref:hypothetical protein n=1 Tax=Mycolicibacterium neoaurum TaxID=1795 RepID=UPI001F4CDF89|nr:hypothetical protein [Mycolicibacterium neoaurum]
MLLLNHIVDIHRLKAIGTNGMRKEMQLHTAGVPCLGLPIGGNTAIENELQIGRAYQFNFAPGTDIRPGDRLMWNGSKIAVKFVRPFIDTPPVSHIEAMCEQEV